MMGKVKEVVHRFGVKRSYELNGHIVLSDVRVAEELDAAAHSAELAAKDQRIAELEKHLQSRGEVIIAERRMMSEREDRNKALEARIAELGEKLESAEGAARSAVHNAQRRLDLLGDAQRQIVELKTARSADARVALADVNERDKRIAELEGGAANLCKRLHIAEGRIAELEAELAKRKELPPLPESVLGWIATARVRGQSMSAATCDLVAWFDTHYPKPVPQWELDARALEEVAKSGVRFEEAGKAVRAIAARIREAHREK